MKEIRATVEKWASIVSMSPEEYNELLEELGYIEKRIGEGGFIILFDALDEVKSNYDELLYELHQLRRDTSNVIVVTSREQNYKDDLCIDFTKKKCYYIGSVDFNMLI